MNCQTNHLAAFGVAFGACGKICLFPSVSLVFLIIVGSVINSRYNVFELTL